MLDAVAGSARSGLMSPGPGDTEASAPVLRGTPDVLAHPRGARSAPSRLSLASPGLCSHLSDVMAGVASPRTVPAQTSSALKAPGRIIPRFCSTHQKKSRKRIAGVDAVNFYVTPPGALDGEGGCEINLPPERIRDPRVD